VATIKEVVAQGMERKMSYIKDLEKKGRLGDTKIRRIDGELQHVNKQEASWIDNYGLLGAEMTKAQGSRTINPETGLRENIAIPWWVVPAMIASAGVATSDKDGWGRINPGNWFGGALGESKLGKGWDKYVGRDSALFGGKSKAKRKALSAIDKRIAEVEGRKENIYPDAMDSFNASNMADWGQLQRSGTGQSLTMANDSSKNSNWQNIIAGNIQKTNASFKSDINRAEDRLWKAEDQIDELEATRADIA